MRFPLYLYTKSVLCSLLSDIDHILCKNHIFPLLRIGSSLGLFKCVPNGKKTLLPLPEGDGKARRSAQLENCIRLLYFISTSISVALGTYTTIIFTLMSIYSKTALGMGLQEKYLEFFNACAKFRVHGFHAFMGSLMSFSFGWTLALFLCVEGDMKWWVAAPAALFTIVGYLHYREIFHLATTLIFS